ncbi:MAG TPA: PAS domain S-box protein [Blastocatellia bacterium]|nr:PAS domain S-box protein [Blastocatellia bacterium]
MERLVEIVRASIETFIEVDHDWRITYVGPRVEKYLRNTDHELIGRNLWEALPGDAGSDFYNECLRVAHEHREHPEDEASARIEVEYGPHGRFAVISVYASSRGISIHSRDITAYKRTELALRESEERFRVLLDSASEAVVVVNSKGTIVLVNTRAEDKFGYRRDEMIGNPIEMLLPTRFRQLHVKHRDGYFEHPRSRSMGAGSALSARRKDGSEFPVEVGLSYAETSSEVLVMGFVTDISERKKAEDQLREQAALLDQTRDAILVRDFQDKILYWNKGAELLYGWTADEAVGRKSTELYYDPTASGYQDAKSVALDRGEWRGEFTHITRNRARILVESSWTLLDMSRGAESPILIINTDVTERKKLESQLLRAQRMESIGTLASGIAHDMNNILAPILMSVQVLKMKIADEDGLRMLSLLESNAERGGDLIRQVLEFARGAEGERILIQPAHIIREIAKILKQTFPRSIETTFSLPAGLGAISGDPTQLHQVMMNLCVNSRDAMPGGGELRITAENASLDENYARMNIEAKPGDYVVISVSDTGIGMPREILVRIFEPFFTTKEHGKGTGLGLSTVIGIVKGHGGFVTVYSEYERGTEFKVYLPIARSEKSKEPQPEDPNLPLGKGELILVVDDEAAILEVTRGTLHSFGYRVMTASDGTEAIALYAKHQEQVKAVVTDMMMPYLDGAATIRALRKINPRVKIIASSGLSENGKVLETASLGIREFLAKPYTAKNLLKVLARVLQTE